MGKSLTTAEEQFLEQTPWANPRHPIHNRINRQFSDQQNSTSIFATPATQKTTMDANATNGSASTIPENLSAQASSALNTPHDQEPHHASSHLEHRMSSNARPGEGLPPRTSLSPTETRKTSSLTQYRPEKQKAMDEGSTLATASPQTRINMYSSPLRPDSLPRASSTQADSVNRHRDSSPLGSLHTTKPGITAGTAYNRFGGR